MVQINVEKDLAALIAPTQDRYTGMRYGQGTILTWNPDTFENTIDFRGITLTNVAVLSGPDALTYRPGDVVGLMGWSPSGGFGAWWILGRVITPGAGAGAQAIDFLATSLGAAVARGVIAESIFTDTVQQNGSRDVLGSFGDIGLFSPPFEPGPQVSFDLEGTSFLAIWGAQAFSPTLQTETTNEFHDMYMGVEIDGPTAIPPSTGQSAFYSIAGDITPTDFVGIRGSTTNTDLFIADPGSYTVTAKYRYDYSGPDPAPVGNADWAARYLIIIAF